MNALQATLGVTRFAKDVGPLAWMELDCEPVAARCRYCYSHD